MAEGMEIFFKKIKLLPSLNNLLENETKGHIKKSLNSANLNFFQHLPPKFKNAIREKTRNQYSML